MTISHSLRRLSALSAIALVAVTLSGCSLITQALNGGESDVFTIKVGDCLNDEASGGEISTVPVVDCEEPHDSEVYASIIMDDDEYPGKDDTIQFADDSCYEAFPDFVGIAYEDSKYSYATLYPTDESWAGGDREVLCRIALADESGTIEPVTGSLKGIEQ